MKTPLINRKNNQAQVALHVFKKRKKINFWIGNLPES